jgi:hypothetical protein
MTPKTFASGPDASGLATRLIEILLARGFVLTELAIAFDAFRIVNQLVGSVFPAPDGLGRRGKHSSQPRRDRDCRCADGCSPGLA